MNYRSAGTLLLSISLLFGCGGGGGGSDSNPCSTIKSGAKVVGGSSCGTGDGRSVALIVGLDSAGNPSEICTGSFISLTSILTAAHCGVGTGGALIVLPGQGVQQASSLSIHPLYDGTVGSPFDVAIMKVTSPSTLAPIPLLTSRLPVSGDKLVAYGYGLDESGKDAIDRVQNSEAPLKATNLVYNDYEDGNIIVSSDGSGAICQGDSGGPTLAQADDGSYGIVGITSATVAGCAAVQDKISIAVSTQSQGTLDFIARVAPDAAIN